jgi:hypothetical protein
VGTNWATSPVQIPNASQYGIPMMANTIELVPALIDVGCAHPHGEFLWGSLEAASVDDACG